MAECPLGHLDFARIRSLESDDKVTLCAVQCVTQLSFLIDNTGICQYLSMNGMLLAALALGTGNCVVPLRHDDKIWNTVLPRQMYKPFCSFFEMLSESSSASESMNVAAMSRKADTTNYSSRLIGGQNFSQNNSETERQTRIRQSNYFHYAVESK